MSVSGTYSLFIDEGHLPLYMVMTEIVKSLTLLAFAFIQCE